MTGRWWTLENEKSWYLTALRRNYERLIALHCDPQPHRGSVYNQ